MSDNRGSLTFFTTYRPTVKTDIFSCPLSPKSPNDESCLTDQVSYNYSGQSIPPQALKSILQQTKVSDAFPTTITDDVDKGLVSGLVFVSERTEGLETLHFSIQHNMDRPKVFQFSDVYGTFRGVRMEDSGCFAAGDYLVYVSTEDPIRESGQPSTAPIRRQPWTAVYKTSLKTEETATRLTPRLTPQGQADLSPAVSPSGTKIAVASFQEKKSGWDGEIEYLNTNIFVMNVAEPYNRRLVVEGGGWPTWGSENVMYFHKLDGGYWGVFRVDLRSDFSASNVTRVTPDDIDAFTPVALSDTKVAVVTIRKRSTFEEAERNVDQFRHIEIFEHSAQGHNESIQMITREVMPKADHYNPFVIPKSSNGADNLRIGYHRSNPGSWPKDIANHSEQLEEIKSPEPGVGLYRVSGAFPSYSADATKLAFVDNEFKTVSAIIDVNCEKKEKILHMEKETNRVFAPIWSQNSEKDTLYVCKGPAFKPEDTVDIYAILNATSDGKQQMKPLISNEFNNAFPCTNPNGTKLVFRSTMDKDKKGYKNLYIIENLDSLENGMDEKAKISRLTSGEWVDTQCVWSPNGKWIAFASNRDKTSDDLDHELDTGHFSVYLVMPQDPDVLKCIEPDVPKSIPEGTKVVRVVASRCHDFAGHVNHPVFSCDGKSLAVVADLAAVSCDPISLPHFIHSVRPYGDIFIVNIDPDNIENNKDVKEFKRITHSRYENSTAVWANFTYTHCPLWKKFCEIKHQQLIRKNYHYLSGGETRHISGHLCIARRSC